MTPQIKEHMRVPRAVPRGGLLVASCVAAVALRAQSPAVPTLVLDKGAVEFPLTYGGGPMLVELRDGRVLSADAKNQEIRVLDFVRGTAEVVVRAGPGPLDYPTTGIFMFGTSDTAVFGSFQRRLIYFSPTGVPVRGVTYDAARIVGMLSPSGIDASGRLYSRGIGLVVGPSRGACPPQPADTIPIMRIDLAAGRADTIARIARQGALTPSLQTACVDDGSAYPRLTQYYTPRSFLAHDTYTALPDGRIAVLRAGDYRVRFIGPDGETLGPPIPHIDVPLTAAERDAAMDSARMTRDRVFERSAPAAYSARMRMEQTARDAGITLPPAPPRVKPEVVEPATWPQFKAPYDFIQLAPDGRLLVGTPAPAGDATRHFDLLDASGALLAHIQLAPGEAFAGLGRGTLYTVHGPPGAWVIRRYKLL